MKAAVYSRYGSPDVLQIKDVETPVPRDNEVLIKVRAASVNPLDGGLIKGMPYLIRLLFGLRKPNDTRLGVDVAGQVEAAGRNVSQFKPADEVFGVCISDPQASAVKVWIPQGAFAEYVCAPESTLVLKPDNVTFEQAASVPVAALTALQGLRDKGRIQPGQKVLINGAAGGVGTFAVQIAKSFGAEVTGVCSTRNVELVRSLGADHVVDYTSEDFAGNGHRYDVVLDLVGNRSLRELRHALTPAGTLVLSGGGVSKGGSLVGPMGLFIKAMAVSRFVRGQRIATLMAKQSVANLATLRELVESGAVRPVVDRTYTLPEAAEAIRYLEIEHARAKVVVTV
jgi:NADPH:quinone reductase-like Zn-dependent oxidoreductase